MTNPNLSEIIILLDRSGSMGSIAKDTKGGFDHFVKQQRESSLGPTLTLYQFDTGGLEIVHESMPIEKVPPLVFHPRGGTPLLDCLHEAITRTGKRFAALHEDARPGTVIFVIITDGQENESKTYKLADVQALIKEHTEVWKWKFTYIGAHSDTFDEAGRLGINYAMTAQASHDAGGTLGAYGALSKSVTRGLVGQSMDYSVDEREEMNTDGAVLPPATSVSRKPDEDANQAP